MVLGLFWVLCFYVKLMEEEGINKGFNDLTAMVMRRIQAGEIGKRGELFCSSSVFLCAFLYSSLHV